MRTKPMAALMLAALIGLGGLTGCGAGDTDPQPTTTEEACYPLLHTIAPRRGEPTPRQPRYAPQTVQDFVDADCKTFWANPTEVLFVDTEGNWRVDLRGFTSGGTEKDKVKFRIIGLSFAVTLPPITGGRRDFGKQLDGYDLAADPNIDNAWPIFLPRYPMSGPEYIVAKVTPDQSTDGLNDYIHPRTVNQLKIGDTGYVSYEGIIRIIDNKGFVISENAAYGTKAGPKLVKITQTATGLTVCLAADKVSTNHSVGLRPNWTVVTLVTC